MSDEQRIRDEYMRWAESPECAQGTAWEGYQGGYRARDAEVQALREALLVTCAELTWAYGNVRAEHSFQAAIEQAEAALAGGETGETE